MGQAVQEGPGPGTQTFSRTVRESAGRAADRPPLPSFALHCPLRLPISLNFCTWPLDRSRQKCVWIWSNAHDCIALDKNVKSHLSPTNLPIAHELWEMKPSIKVDLKPWEVEAVRASQKCLIESDFWWDAFEFKLSNFFLYPQVDRPPLLASSADSRMRIALHQFLSQFEPRARTFQSCRPVFSALCRTWVECWTPTKVMCANKLYVLSCKKGMVRQAREGFIMLHIFWFFSSLTKLKTLLY